jgi:hypothetical protein
VYHLRRVCRICCLLSDDCCEAKWVDPRALLLNIVGGDYTTAYSYLDSNATIDGLPVDQQAFTRLAKAADAQDGTAPGIVLSTENDATHVTMTVSRGSRSYDVHLVLQQEHGTWKIISADGI